MAYARAISHAGTENRLFSMPAITRSRGVGAKVTREAKGMRLRVSTIGSGPLEIEKKAILVRHVAFTSTNAVHFQLGWGVFVEIEAILVGNRSFTAANVTFGTGKGAFLSENPAFLDQSEV